MKMLGLIGGTGWLSTIDYYRYINEGINARLGGLNYARCMIYSFNFEDIRRNNEANDWEATLRMVTEAGRHLKNAGASALVLCANTMHLIADEVEQAVGLPVIHIAEATAAAVRRSGLKSVALLGTRFTMEKEFFRSRLARHHINTLIPDEEDRIFIHAAVFEELNKGIFSETTRSRFLRIIHDLHARGAGGVILGCTEFPLLLPPETLSIPSFDTTRLHAEAAVAFALLQE